MIELHGIPNCDTVRKARAWLDAHGLSYRFHDFKKSGVDAETLRGWAERLGWEVMLNRAGTTFRTLPEADKADLDADKAIATMLVHPSTIKRPILVNGDVLLAGFRPDTYLTHLTT